MIFYRLKHARVNRLSLTQFHKGLAAVRLLRVENRRPIFQPELVLQGMDL